MLRKHVISTKDGRQWQGIPAIARAPNGRLWCSFFSGGPKEPDPDNFILLTTSEDDGATWAMPAKIVDPPGQTRVYDPALWHDPSGQLWLFYNQANLDEKNFSVWAMTASDSGAPELSWSEPVRLPLPVPFAFRLNKPTVLDCGDWLLPVTWARSSPEDWFAGDPQLQGVAISTDAGATWSFHGSVETPPWALENMMVELRSGSVWMLIRTNSGVVWQSCSSDRGRTWSEASPTDIVNPGARFFTRRLASGRLLLINTPDPRQRNTLSAYLSEDDGATWSSRGLVLDDRDKVSYPDAVQAPDGLIYSVHDCDRQGSGEIVLSVFSEEDVLAELP